MYPWAAVLRNMETSYYVMKSRRCDHCAVTVLSTHSLCSLWRTCCLTLGYRDKWALSCLWLCSKCLGPLDEKLRGLVLFANFGIEALGGGRGFFSLFFSVQPSRWLSSNLMITDIARGLIQFHSTPYWTEMRAKFFSFFILWTPRSSVIPFPSHFRCSYKRTATVTQPLTSLSHIRHWAAVLKKRLHSNCYFGYAPPAAICWMIYSQNISLQFLHNVGTD